MCYKRGVDTVRGSKQINELLPMKAALINGRKNQKYVERTTRILASNKSRLRRYRFN